MIKGVNKRIVEITSTEHEYFEKAVLYVRADKSNLPTEKITEEAKEYLERIVPMKKVLSTGNKLLIGLLLLLFALIVALIILL